MKHNNILRYGLKAIIAFVLFIGCVTNGNAASPVSGPGYLNPAKKDGIVRILAIGNSFSEDAIEFNLYELVKAGGKKVVIANLNIGGSSLELHVQNATGNIAAYNYRKIDTSGVKKNYSQTAIVTALKDECWDYISFQQVSQNSGQYNTIEKSLPVIYNYVKENNPNPRTKYILHQTWAYAQNSTHAGFANYGKDQMVMYNAIVNAYTKAKKLISASFIVPSGTAIQNARTSFVGDNLCRDGFHLSIPLGRYIAACTWYEAIFGKNVIGNSYYPAGLSEREAQLCQHAAHLAVKQPERITRMEKFQEGEKVDNVVTGAIHLNFGPVETLPAGWNGLTSFAKGAAVALKNDKGEVIITIGEKNNNSNGFYYINAMRITEAQL